MFVVLQIFFTARTVLKIGEYHMHIPNFNRGLFSHVLCLDQLQGSDNI